MSSININVTPGGGGTFSGRFTNGRTFSGLTPVSSIIKPTYTFTNNTSVNTQEYFELDSLRFTPTNGTACDATAKTGNTTLTILPLPAISAMLTTLVNTCSGNTVSISLTNPTGVSATYDLSINYNGATGTKTNATGQAYPSTFTDVITTNSATGVTVTYTFTPKGTGSPTCTGTPVSISVTVFDDNRIYVNDGSTTGDTYTYATGVDASGNGTRCAPYRTIQFAINNAVAGDTIYVDGGTYAENVLVNKSVAILGPNQSINPNTGARVAEAIVIPVTAQTSTEGSTSGTIFRLGNSTGPINVTIKGFTIDGTNAALSGGRTLNGISVKTGAGIVNSISSFDANPGGYNVQMIVQNNIIQNLERYGVLADGVAARTPMAGTNVSFNKIDNLPSGNNFGGGRGRGIAFEENHYGTASGNVITRVNVGWQGDNFNEASPGAGTVVSNNNIKSYHRGIFHNLQYQTATPANISNNTLAVETTGAFPASGSNFGIELASIQSAASATVTGNNVSGQVFGILLWNNPTTDTITVTGGTLTNNLYGIYATNVDPQFMDGASSNYKINGVTITGGTNGIYVNDSSSSASGITVKVAIQGGTSISGTANGLVLSGADATASFNGANPASFAASNTKYIVLRSNGTNAPGNVTATTASFNGQTGTSASPAQNFAIEDKIDHKIDSLPLGFVTVKTANAFVTDIAPVIPTATNNDYTRVRNGILAASNGFTINHDGNFNWVETNAAASWAAGNDGVSGNGDDYRILVPANLNLITFTTPAPITPATIQGPGDVPTANLESLLRFDGSGLNQGWTISNMNFLDFDLSIGMFNGAGGTDAYDNTTITNNTFRVPRDLNTTVAPADANQNIGIHYSFGSNQTISNNTFTVDGTGISNGTANFSTSVVMQSNTSGGTVYDGLQITGNTITVTGVPATSPNQSVIRGIWENSQSTGAAINISSNKFSNAAAGNTADLNRQTAFWVTSGSDATKKVEYKNNEVSGCRDGIAWLGGMFTGNTPPDYNTGETPAEIMNNKFDGLRYGVVIRKSAASTNPGSPAIINFNSFTNTVAGGYAISNEGTGDSTNATCNWYGTVGQGAIAALDSGKVIFSPYLLDGTDNNLAIRGFQTTAVCGVANELFVNDGTPAGDSYTAAVGNDNNSGTAAAPYATLKKAINSAVAGNTIKIDAGTYLVKDTVNKSLTILGPAANTTVSGCAARAAEAILIPSSSQPFYDGTTEVRMLQITANNVAVKGLTFDGNNPALTTNIIDAADGIDVFADVNTITIQNNIFKNLNEGGVTGFPSGATTQGNNVVTNNKFDNIPGNVGAGFPNSGYGIGVLVYNNFYATVNNNCMTNVRIGVQTGNYNLAGSPATISNNQIESRAIGIWHNLAYQNASPFTINNNTLTTATGAASNTGLFVSSIFETVSASITNNTVTGAKWGVELWNNPTTSTITINGGTLTNCETGVFANNYDSYPDPMNLAADSNNAIVNNVAITGGITGIHVKDNTANTNSTATSAVKLTNSTSISGSTTGLLLTGRGAFASFTGTGTPAVFTGQTKYITLVDNGADAPTSGIDATTVSFDGQTGATASATQNFAIEDKIDHRVDSLPLGFVTVKAANAFVTDIAPLAPTATNNDYSRIRNAVQTIGTNWTINNNGTFDWREPNAAAAWALGNDGVAGVPATPNNIPDDYSILIPDNRTGVTFTAPLGLGTATIQGPGDLSNVNMEMVLYFSGSNYQNWTISNMKFLDFDWTLGMFTFVDGNNYGNLKITNNMFRLPADLTSDASLNVGIRLSLGFNQEVSNNTFEIAGNGVSNGTNYSRTDAIQTNFRDGGMQFDGLKIKNNTFTVTGLPSADPAVMRTVFENCSNTGVAMELSGNIFSNANPANSASINRQTAFWISSQSQGAKKIEYKNNEIKGFREGLAWVGGAFSSGNSPAYNTNEGPVEILNNKFDSTLYGVVVRKDPSSTNPGSPGIINFNSFTNTRPGGYAISNESTAADTTAATCNWYGTTNANTVATFISGKVAYIPYLNNGTDGSPNTGFQPTAMCVACTTLSGTVTQTATTCANASNGELTVTVNNPQGVTPYSYVITSGPTINTTGASSGVFTGLSQGTYTITVFTANGCSTALAPAVVRDQVAPIFTVCPAPVTGRIPNTTGCQASVDPPDPAATDNCTTPSITYTLSGATVNNVPAPAPIGAMNFNVGTTTITYTATDQSGNIATCSTSVTVVNNLKDSISGTAVVTQNNNTTSNITFYANGGTGPYTFTYNINGGPNQTVSTTGSNSTVTVLQNNAVVGQYIYTLLSGTDVYGCAAAIASDNKDTITVTATSNRPDFTVQVSRPVNTTFTAGQVRDGYITISNVATVPSTGQITFRISNTNNFMLSFPAGNTTPNNGFTINNTDWTITPGAFFYTVTSKPNVVINGGAFSRIGFVVTATGSNGSQGIMTITILNDTGGSSVGTGDSNSSNNQSVVIFAIN